MDSTASYAGTLLDENDRPMADRSLQVFVKTSAYEAVAAQQTDSAGRFRFPVVPANVPLELNLRHEGEEQDYYLFDRDRMLKPGEVREGDRLKASRAGSSAPAARPTVPLAESVEKPMPERPRDRDARPDRPPGRCLAGRDHRRPIGSWTTNVTGPS